MLPLKPSPLTSWQDWGEGWDQEPGPKVRGDVLIGNLTPSPPRDIRTISAP